MTLAFDAGTYLEDIECPAGNEIWAVGAGGTLVYYDGSWKKRELGNQYSLNRVLVRENRIWAVGAVHKNLPPADPGHPLDGVVLLSSDRGRTWQELPIDAKELYDVYISGSTGWLIGTHGEIFRSADGGNSWLRVESPTTNTLRNVFFLGKDGWIVGDRATVLKYNN